MFCPNCGDIEMTSNVGSAFAKRTLTHTCPVCGYSEKR